VATPVVLVVLVRLLLDLRRRVASGPGRGFEDPLLAEEVRLVTSAGIASGQPVAGGA
jgi:hypothetical protein